MGRMCVETMPKIGVRGMLQSEIPHDHAVYVVCKPEDRVIDPNKITLANADVSELPPMANFPGHPSLPHHLYSHSGPQPQGGRQG